MLYFLFRVWTMWNAFISIKPKNVFKINQTCIITFTSRYFAIRTNNQRRKRMNTLICEKGLPIHTKIHRVLLTPEKSQLKVEKISGQKLNCFLALSFLVEWMFYFILLPPTLVFQGISTYPKCSVDYKCVSTALSQPNSFSIWEHWILTCILPSNISINDANKQHFNTIFFLKITLFIWKA